MQMSPLHIPYINEFPNALPYPLSTCSFKNSFFLFLSELYLLNPGPFTLAPT